MREFICRLAVVLLIVCALQVHAQSLMFRHYDIGTTGKAISINCVAQDDKGMMWIGCSKGLYTFDGSYFHSQNVHDSLSYYISAICADSSNIWFGTKDGTLGHRSLYVWKTDLNIDTSFSSPIVQIIHNQQGLWVATYGSGLFLLQSGKWMRIGVVQGLPTNEIYSMSQTEDGSVWLGTDGGLTHCLVNEDRVVISTLTTNEGLPDDIVKCVKTAEDGMLWIGMYGKGICKFDPRTKQFTALPFSIGWNYGPVTTLAIQNNKRLFIGTTGKGIVSIDLESNYYPTLINSEDGYTEEKITDLMIDSEGNIWAANINNSLDQFPALFEWAPISAQNILAVLYDSKNTLWYATLQGLFYQHMDSSGGKQVASVSLGKLEKFPVITSIYEDRKGGIWVGSFDAGVFYHPARALSFVRLTEDHGLANNNVLNISGSDSEIWISTLGGVSHCAIPENNKTSSIQFKNYTEENGLHSSYIYQTFVDSKGRVWFATDGEGIKVLDNGQFFSYSEYKTDTFKTVYSITEDKAGNIWFSTPSKGIYKFDGTTFTNYNESDDISDLDIAGIITDDNGDLLILEKDGIEILERKFDQVRHYRGRPYFEGLVPNINACFKDIHGNIWIATKNGVLKYFTPSPKFSDEAQLEITQVSVFLEPIDFISTNKFHYNQNHIAFDFQGFWNYYPSEVRYRYILDGYDLDWIKTKDERVIYPNLPPGTYTFKIQATIHHNFDDALTRSFIFTVETPFWKTWWFIFACLMAAGLLIYIIIWARVRKIEREGKINRERIEFQLENLKTQINPHFLFNSFNTLATLIEEDQQLAVGYVNHLADFYRSTLRFKDTDLITLKEECELTENYVFLLRHRHGNSLQVDSDIDEKYMQWYIPPLTLQILIENAVKHNVVSKENPLTIDIYSEENDFLYVRNNRQRKDEAVISTNIGLKNIHARFELLENKKVEVLETEQYFEVKLPLTKNQK